MGLALFRLPFGISALDFDTTFLVSRHPHTIGVSGIFGPLSPSIWVIAALSGFVFYLVEKAFKLEKKQLSRGNAIFNMVVALLGASIIITYNLDLRSNLIEPQFETIAKNLAGIDYKYVL